jgi:hypothetical protein
VARGCIRVPRPPAAVLQSLFELCNNVATHAVHQTPTLPFDHAPGSQQPANCKKASKRDSRQAPAAGNVRKRPHGSSRIAGNVQVSAADGNHTLNWCHHIGRRCKNQDTAAQLSAGAGSCKPTSASRRPLEELEVRLRPKLLLGGCCCTAGPGLGQDWAWRRRDGNAAAAAGLHSTHDNDDNAAVDNVEGEGSSSLQQPQRWQQQQLDFAALAMTMTV